MSPYEFHMHYQDKKKQGGGLHWHACSLYCKWSL